MLSVMVAEPFALAAGVYVSVPVELTAGPVENSAALVLLVIIETYCLARFVGRPRRTIRPQFV
jgi:hypothetical protein